MIKRTKYINEIRPFIQKPVIKVITGIRRCGKSTLMLQLIDELLESGINKNQIIYINKELYQFDEIKNYKNLHQYVSAKAEQGTKTTFLFVDEIQEIEEWERAINSFLAENLFDIYITGSNAGLFSSELSTLITGRYIEFKMNTLSFSEFLQFTENNNKLPSSLSSFDAFLRYGGFPGIHAFEWVDNGIRQYLHAVYSTILLRDIVIRNNIRDAAMLEKIIEYMIDNCGNITTAKSISDYVKSQFRKVSVDTVQNYIHYACNALLLYKIPRFDIKGKKPLETHEKYFLSDIGFRFATLGFTPESLPAQLENIVLLELLSRGYRVQIGKILEKEVDFIAQKNNEKLYIQVCYMLNDPRVVDREYGSLEAIPDHFPKLVLSLDAGFDVNRHGIRWMNLKEFLMQ